MKKHWVLLAMPPLQNVGTVDWSWCVGLITQRPLGSAMYTKSTTPNQRQQTRNPTKTTNTQLTKNNEPTKPTNTQPYKKPATARNQQTQKQNTHQSQQTHKKQQTHNKNNKHTKPTNTKAKHTPKLGFRHCCFSMLSFFLWNVFFFLSWLG